MKLRSSGIEIAVDEARAKHLVILPDNVEKGGQDFAAWALKLSLACLALEASGLILEMWGGKAAGDIAGISRASVRYTVDDSLRKQHAAGRHRHVPRVSGCETALRMGMA